MKNPRWQEVITEELERKAEERSNVPHYTEKFLLCLREILSAERIAEKTSVYGVQQNIERAIRKLASDIQEGR